MHILELRVGAWNVLQKLKKNVFLKILYILRFVLLFSETFKLISEKLKNEEYEQKLLKFTYYLFFK